MYIEIIFEHIYIHVHMEVEVTLISLFPLSVKICSCCPTQRLAGSPGGLQSEDSEQCTSGCLAWLLHAQPRARALRPLCAAILAGRGSKLNARPFRSPAPSRPTAARDARCERR